ncbi:MAG: hypothetical protein U1E49_01725 [Hyphomicrobiaceae bacterium]
MLQQNGKVTAGAAGHAAAPDQARTASRVALVIGLLLGGAAVIIAQAALPALSSVASKTEDRLVAGARASAEDAAACTALLQDRSTGSTVAVDCGSPRPGPAQRPAREIES